ncbi:MAG: hypothetical protein E6J83_18350, partial [Deltaproteobacteria bacterium]
LADGVLGPRGRWVALGSGGAVLAVAVVLLPGMQIGDPGSASRILAAGAEYNRSHRAVQDAFGGSEPFMVVAEGDGRDALQRVGVLRTIESFQRFLERTPVVGASFSLVDILKSMGQLFHELEPRWAVIPEEEQAIRTMFFTYWGSVFPSTSTQYFTPDFATAPITFYCRDHTVEHVRALVAAAREFIATHPLPHVQFRLAGGFIGVMAAVYDEILRSQARMTAASFLVIFLVLDYGIYILSRVAEAVRGGTSLEGATHEALRHAGRTVAFTALTMTAGMLCFTATALRFVGEMAALLALWMVSSAATALVVLPALLVVIRPRFLAAGRDEPGR